MNGWLLDTNVISELRRPRPDAQVAAFVAGQALESLYVSAVTLAELRYGIERVDDVAKRADLSDWLTHRVRPLFGSRVLPISEDVMLTWRLMVEKGRKAGHTFSQPDLLIAATAAHHGLTVVTRDIAEFERAGVAFSNPWSADPATNPRPDSGARPKRRR